MKTAAVIAAFLFLGCSQHLKFDLDKTLELEREDLIVMGVVSHLNEKSNYGKEMHKLNTSEKIVLIADNLQSEVNNGGFDQFYYNSSGNFANETVEILSLVNATKTARIVNKANDQFPEGIVPQSRNIRIEVLQSIRAKSTEVWDSLDSQFYRPNTMTGKMEVENLSKLLLDFIKSHRSDFR